MQNLLSSIRAPSIFWVFSSNTLDICYENIYEFMEGNKYIEGNAEEN